MGKRWTSDEDEWIREFSQTDNIKMLYRKFCSRCKSEGWPDRTMQGFVCRISTLGESRLAELGGWRCTEMARQLNITSSRVYWWINQGFLNAPKLGKATRITLSDFNDFASSHPEKLRGIDPERLKELLPQGTIDRILQHPVGGSGVRFKLKRLDTGEVFNNGVDAANRTLFCHTEILRSAREGVPIGGVQFVRFDMSMTDYGAAVRVAK